MNPELHPRLLPFPYLAPMFNLRALSLFISLAICHAASFRLCAQRNVRDSSVVSSQIVAHFALQRPSYDLEERFGDNASVGAAYYRKTRSNFHVGIEFSYLFGNTVKEPGILSNLRTEAGEIIDNNGQIATVWIQQRGYTLSLSAGRIFPVFGSNPNSGILFKVGGGFIQHKIRYEHQVNEISQLEGDYLKGYDRLTNGLMLSQFLGYHYMSNNRLSNFYFGLELIQGFTRGRRNINFDTGLRDDEDRFDMLYGLRLAWIIPIYKRAPQVYY